MFDPKTLDELSSRLASALPPGLSSFKEEVEKHIHAMLQTALGKLDLVTREEFDVQKMVLAKTRSKLEDLEKRVADLEQQLLPKEEQIEPVPLHEEPT